MQEAREENPNLVAFLEERLPQLGLDGETYGGYVLGTSDNDELAEIIELLKASSSGGGDDNDDGNADGDDQDLASDDAVWEQLMADIQTKLQLDQDFRDQKAAEHRQHNKALLEEQLAQAKLEQEQGKQQQQPAKSGGGSNNSAVDEATKQALLSRFAYENDNEDEQGGGGGGGGDDEAPLTNKQLAAQANLDKARELKAQKGTTKREEQQKTKEQRNSKQQLKEERRKKTVKGERKR